MPPLPLDVLHVIKAFADLDDRYRWSQTSRAFKFIDWKPYLQVYKVGSLKELTRLIQRDYDVSWFVQQRTNCLWSTQLNEPLTVWTPWTPASLCQHQEHCTRMYFRECRFVHTIRHWASKFCAIGTCRYLWTYEGHDCVVATLWTKNRTCIPTVYKTRNGTIRKRKRYWFSTFRMPARFSIRALISLRLKDGTLRLFVQGLEFLIE